MPLIVYLLGLGPAVLFFLIVSKDDDAPRGVLFVARLAIFCMLVSTAMGGYRESSICAESGRTILVCTFTP